MEIPFRIGTSSYIIPDDILPNVRFLAGKVQDIELVLFEVDDGPNNLPQPATIKEMRQISQDNNLTYTVHLPLDLRLGADGSEQSNSLLKAHKVIDCTRELEPWAYVLHLDGREVKEGAESADMRGWNDQAARSLEIVADWGGGADKLAVENLEGYPFDFWEEVLRRYLAGRCVDIGHLWRDGHDPIPYLERAIDRTRVIHIHGIAERDHQSLEHVPQDELTRVLKWLVLKPYRGVMTVEIFGEKDFISSMVAIRKALQRIEEGGLWANG